MKVPFGQKKILALIVVVALGAAVFLVLWFQHRTPVPMQGPKPVATVQGKVLTEQDLADYDRIYNGLLRLQHSADPKVTLASRDEVLKELVNVTLIEIEAGRRGISVSDAEVSARKRPNVSALLLGYGWSEKDYEQFIRLQLLREKIEDAVTTWRDAEFVSIRFDVFPKEHPPLTLEEFQGKATGFLEKIKTDFAAGKDVKLLAEGLKLDPKVVQIFPPNTIQYRILSKNPQALRTAHTASTPFNQKLLSADEHILQMKYPTSAQIWCGQDACYLIRVLAGNDGTYKTLDEWLRSQPR